MAFVLTWDENNIDINRQSAQHIGNKLLLIGTLVVTSGTTSSTANPLPGQSLEAMDGWSSGGVNVSVNASNNNQIDLALLGGAANGTYKIFVRARGL